MIAASSSGARFDALAGYLDAGSQRRDPERVAWSVGRNLPTDEPAAAAVLMHATADRNRHVREPMYHVVLSAPPGESVSRVQLEQIADRVLRDLGLADHQALLVAHRDKDHPHVHVMVNRVHPETGRAWSRWQDQAQIQRTLRELEHELGLTPVPGRLYQRPEQLPPERPRLTRGEQEQAVRTGVLPLAERARDRLADIREAVSWPDLEDRLAAHGLRLERKGQGLVITDGDTAVKASRIARDVSLRRLDERFGVAYDQRESAPALPPDVARLARDLRVYERVETLHRAGFAVETEASAAAARRDQLATAMARAERAHQAFEQGMTRLYRDPAMAMATFRAQLAAEGAEATIARLRTQPETFGALATVDRTRLGGLWTSRDDAPARAAAIDVAGLGHEVERAEHGVRAAAAASHARRVEAAFTGALARAYRDPVAARAAWERLTATQGPDQAAALVRRTPEQLGPLTAGDGITARSARFHADRAAVLGGSLETARRERSPTSSLMAERGAAEQAAVRARVRARVIDRDRAADGTPHLDALRRSIAVQLHRLAPPELAQLTQLVTAPQAALASRIRSTVRDLALGREEGLSR